jgi:hypothetical protein
VTRVEVIRPFVEQTVKDFLGVEQLQVLDDGTIPIRVGSTAVNVRLMQTREDSEPLLQVFAPILHGVAKSPELLEKLNEMNANFTSARTFWVNDQVLIAMEIPADTLDKQQVGYACSLISFAADYWDDVLKGQFGGEIAFNEAAPATGAEAPSGTPPVDASPGAAPEADPRTEGYL